MQTVHKRVQHAVPEDADEPNLSSKNVKPPKRKKRLKRGKKNEFRSEAALEWAAIILALAFLLACLAFLSRMIINLFTGNQRHQSHVEESEGEEQSMGPTLFPNLLYPLPEAHPEVGERSNTYARLRMKYDQLLPVEYKRSLAAVSRIRENTDYNFQVYQLGTGHSDEFGAYDIFNCPSHPPEGYPYSWKIADILANWPPSDPDHQPPAIYQGLCVFDYERDYDKALTYRTAELPFVVRGDPEVARTVERWQYPGFVDELMGPVRHRAEYSTSNQFMYYAPQPKKLRSRPNNKVPENWKPPTEQLRMKYSSWLEKANVTDDKLGPDQEHWYFRLIGCGYMGATGDCDKGSSEYLFDELPFFQPKKDLYLTEPREQKGIHCRFGMKGVIAENHFDASRNAIVVLGGSRRYILSHPDQCNKLNLYPQGHPSARHSQMDWSNPDYETYPEMLEAEGNEVVMQAGDVLYLPTFWFHFIISLDLNMQCNTRSGKEKSRSKVMRQCGF